MKSCVAIWAVDAPDVATRLKAFSDAGFEAVSLNDALRVQAEEQRAEVERILSERDLDVSLHLAFGTGDEKDVVQAVSNQIEAAAEWQRSTGRVLTATFDSAYRPDEREADKIWNPTATITGLKYALEQLAPLDIKVGIENWLICHRLDQFQMMYQGVGRKDLCMLLDVGHLFIASNTPEVEVSSMSEWIKSVPMDIVELHLHDNDGLKDQHLPLGDGEIDLRSIVDALKKRGFDGIATVEVGPPPGHRDVREKEVIDRLIRTRETFESILSSAPA